MSPRSRACSFLCVFEGRSKAAFMVSRVRRSNSSRAQAAAPSSAVSALSQSLSARHDRDPAQHRKSPQDAPMLVVTTHHIEGKRITKYHGVVSGEAILGANIFRDFFAGIRDIVGGRSGSYEKELGKARKIAIDEMTERAEELGANAIVGIDIDYETVGQGSMLMVAVSGTAVTVA